LECGYRLDIVIDDRVLIELKAVEKLLPIHEAQVVTYLRLAELPVGLLVNFNVSVLRAGLRRLTREHPKHRRNPKATEEEEREGRKIGRP
jgi:GxxExxY protein